MNDVKKMDITEFRTSGYLQEVNRIFFHPHGLALMIEVIDGKETIAGIWDKRDEQEGVYFDLSNSDADRIETFKQRSENISKIYTERAVVREKILGFVVEPIPNA